jgi:hypothetical protein
MAEPHEVSPPPTYPECLVPCRVEPGIFRDEWIVLIDAADPKDPGRTIPTEMFADKRLVVGVEDTPARRQPVKGWLRATQMGTEDGLALILLPQYAFPGGTYLMIDKSLVKPEGAA